MLLLTPFRCVFRRKVELLETVFPCPAPGVEYKLTPMNAHACSCSYLGTFLVRGSGLTSGFLALSAAHSGQSLITRRKKPVTFLCKRSKP